MMAFWVGVLVGWVTVPAVAVVIGKAISMREERDETPR